MIKRVNGKHKKKSGVSHSIFKRQPLLLLSLNRFSGFRMEVARNKLETTLNSSGFSGLFHTGTKQYNKNNQHIKEEYCTS
jgi:hypothetical protein